MQEIAVTTCEYKKARSPSILSSGWMGPCISVGVISGEEGYMSHDVSEPVYLERLLQDVKDRADLQFYVVGGGLSSDETRFDFWVERRKKFRQVVLDMISDAGYGNALRVVRWGRLDTGTSLKLVLPEGGAEFIEIYDSSAEVYDRRKAFLPSLSYFPFPLHQ